MKKRLIKLLVVLLVLGTCFTGQNTTSSYAETIYPSIFLYNSGVGSTFSSE